MWHRTSKHAWNFLVITVLRIRRGGESWGKSPPYNNFEYFNEYLGYIHETFRVCRRTLKTLLLKFWGRCHSLMGRSWRSEKIVFGDYSDYSSDLLTLSFYRILKIFVSCMPRFPLSGLVWSSLLNNQRFFSTLLTVLSVFWRVAFTSTEFKLHM